MSGDNVISGRPWRGRCGTCAAWIVIRSATGQIPRHQGREGADCGGSPDPVEVSLVPVDRGSAGSAEQDPGGGLVTDRRSWSLARLWRDVASSRSGAVAGRGRRRP